MVYYIAKMRVYRMNRTSLEFRTWYTFFLRYKLHRKNKNLEKTGYTPVCLLGHASTNVAIQRHFIGRKVCTTAGEYELLCKVLVTLYLCARMVGFRHLLPT